MIYKEKRKNKRKEFLKKLKSSNISLIEMAVWLSVLAVIIMGLFTLLTN